MKKLFTLAFLFLLLSSHELFLKSESYFFEKNSPADLFLYNGSFDLSENTITRDRIMNPEITGPEYTYEPTAEDYRDEDEVTHLKFTTGKPGTYAAGISTKPRIIQLSGEKFTGYLEHEGLDHIIAKRKESGISGKPAREKYAKHVKALFQVGKKRTDHYATRYSYPIEFLPLKNPYLLSVGESMVFRLMYQEEPLANATVHISSRNYQGEISTEETALKTDRNGEVSFTLTNPGHWYIATIHMIESEEEDLDYESHWATITWQTR